MSVWLIAFILALVIPLIMAAGCLVVLILYGEEDTQDPVRIVDEEEL
jgi:hypothetical protein